MRTTRLQPFLLTLIAAVLLAGPAAAKEKRQPIEKLKARAISLDRGAASNLDITIYEWTTPTEREELIRTFVEGGSKALYDALDQASDKGYVKAPRTLGYDMKYAFQFEVEGKRRIVLATARPFAFLEMARNTRSTDYDVSLMVLDVDPETGEGEGQATGGAELSIKDGKLQIEIAGTQPTRLTRVKSVPLKKKR